VGNFWWETFINEHYNLGSILASPSFIYFLYIPMQTRERVMKKIILMIFIFCLLNIACKETIHKTIDKTIDRGFESVDKTMDKTFESLDKAMDKNFERMGKSKNFNY